MQEIKSGIVKILGVRIRQWRKSILLKSYQLAKLIKISQGSLLDIENSKSLPYADTIAKLYQHNNLNIIWLLTDKGLVRKTQFTPVKEREINEGFEALEKIQNLVELIQRLIQTYYRNDEEKKMHLRSFLIGTDPGE